jgi:uncharacterized protein (TIGR03067 family)
MNQQTCNLAWLDAFLKNDLNQREEQMLTSHLDECSDCREELESRAAEESVWREASSLLGGSILPSTAAISDSRSSTVHSPQIALVLQQLAPTDDPESLGRIGGYEVTGVVGAGGMGVVLKAHDRSLDRMVAIKVMSPHLASHGSARKRFAREAKAAAAVLHPNVIAIHSVASEDANPYLVMPFVRGASLQKRIDLQGPLPLKDTLRIGSQIAAGLAAAHEQGLVHRDIKPANILLEEGVERVTITDFGLARAVDDASMTCSGVIAGTPQYMSPEQARGEPIDARSDLFSLGGVLYAMCTGRSPFRAETTFGVLHRIANDKPTPVCEVNTDVPVWLGQVIERLMAKRPEDRFESAAQVAELLEGCLAHVQQPAAMPLPEAVAALAPKKTRRPPIGKFIAAAAFGACALLFAGVLIVLELGKGTLTIESEMDNVPIRIMQREKIVDEMVVAKGENAVRISAGKYVVELDTKLDGIVVEGGTITLRMGDKVRVRVKSTLTTKPEGVTELEGVWHLESVVGIDGKQREILTPDHWTFRGNRLLYEFASAPAIECDVEVDSTAKTLRTLRNGKDLSSKANYELNKDQLVLYEDPPMKKILRRGRSLHGKTADASHPATAPMPGSETKSSDNDPQSLAYATKSYNEKTSELRRSLFAPPIPDLTVEQVREGLRKAVEYYRRGGKHQVANTLQKIAETNRLPDGILMFLTGPYAENEHGETLTRQIVPGMILPDNTSPGGYLLAPIRPLELLYGKDGKCSKTYGDSDWDSLPAVDNGAATRTAAKNLSADQWLDKLQGNWNVVQQHFDNGIPKRGLYSATVRGNRMEITPAHGQGPMKYDLFIGESGPPQQIDLRLALSDRERQAMVEDGDDIDAPLPVLTGIIETDGDLISICSSNASDSPHRPIQFMSGEEQMLWNFTRTGELSATSSSQSKSSPEFPPVKIVVHDEEGKPLEGVKVSLIQLAKDQGGQVLEINETSNASGLAVNRNLPYGHYELSATTADGWFLSGHGSKLNVEFEKGLSLKLVAPTPAPFGRLTIRDDANLRLAGSAGLRFGTLEELVNNGPAFSISQVPEPDGDLGEYSNFPTVTNGIEQVGIEIRFEMMAKNISQPSPSGTHLNSKWKWTPVDKAKSSCRYLIVDGQARAFVNQSVYHDIPFHGLPMEECEMFKLPSAKHRVGGSLFALHEPTAMPLEIEIPAGEMSIYVERIIGKPSLTTMKALNWEPHKDQPELWLEADVQRDSAWFERLIDTSAWIRTNLKPGFNEISGHLQMHKLIRAGETLEVSLSPKQIDQKTSSASAARTLDDTTPVYNNQVQERHAEQFQGEWRLAHVFHHPTLTSDSSCVIGISSLVVGHKADQPPHRYIYTLRGQSEIDLRPSISEGLGAPQLGRYLFKNNRLFIAFNQDPNTKERPVYATMEDPIKGVTLLILERVGNAESAATK